MADSPSSAVLPGLTFEAVEWLPSGAESGLVRVRGRWVDDDAREDDLPVLALRAAGQEHRFESLPDARFSRDSSSWRGTYLVAASLVASEPETLWLEWPSGARSGLPELAHGVEPPPVAERAEAPEETEPGGQVIDRAVLAERRARRAEESEQAQTRRAAEALKAVEVLELRSAELERRLEEATAERDALASVEPAGREALSEALASAAALRARSRDLQLCLRANETARSSDAVRLAVLGVGVERDPTAQLESALAEARARAAEAETARDEAASRAAELRATIEAARTEAAERAAELAAATEAAADARAELARERDTGVQARAAWERRRTELEAALADVRGQLEQARAEVGDRVGTLEQKLSAADGRLETETVARTALEDELDREREAHAAERATVTDLRASFEAATADLDRLRGEVETRDGEIDRLRAAASEVDRLRSEIEARDGEVERLRGEVEVRDGEIERLRSEFEAREADVERLRAEAVAAKAALEAARRAPVHEGAAGPKQLDRLAREQAAAAAAREPTAGAARIAADLDAAANALRSRTPEPPAPDAEPRIEPHADRPSAPPPAAEAPHAAVDRPPPASEPRALTAEPSAPDAEPAIEATTDRSRAAIHGAPHAPDAEPAVDWVERDVERDGRTVTPGVQPPRGPIDLPLPPEPPITPPAGAEPPAPDAEPAVEWTEGVSHPPSAATPAEPADEAPATATAAEPTDEASAAAARPAGPRVVPAKRPPTRAAMTGTSRREYPLLRGAVVKLAHDDPRAAANLLAALLPAQAAVLKDPITYDLTIRELGTYGVTIAGGRPYVERLERPRPRSQADFHLTGDALPLAELLAGVDRRIRRFFGPVRLRGRRGRLDLLKALASTDLTLADAARAGVAIEPRLVYRALGYAVHPSWTRGHAFTVAQTIAGEPPETWYLTARDGAGLAVSGAGIADATVTMSRATFDRMFRGEPVPSGERPVVRGNHDAVATLREWTLRVQGV